MRRTERRNDDEPVIVIFRKWRPSEGGDVIALMPELPATTDGRLCTSYQHIGQHAAADYQGVIAQTRPAAPEEYAALKRELESAPYRYRFDVRRRWMRGRA